MKYVQLGASGLEVSRICLGTMNFGRVTDESQSHRILDLALERGINYVDTANMYGTAQRPHASEETIGKWLASNRTRRDKIVLATKAYEATTAWPNHGGLSAANFRRACDDSLRRLNTDHIDVFQMHHPDVRVPWEEIAEAYDVLRQQGKILYAGSSNFAGWHLALAQSTAIAQRAPRIISEQSVYSLANRAIESELLPASRALGIGVVAWSPLAGGLLTEGSSTTGRRASADHVARVEKHREQLDRTRVLASEFGISISTLALAWLLSRPGIVAPIVGPRTADHLDSAATALDVSLRQDVLVELDTIWPGPGEAPASYAW